MLLSKQKGPLEKNKETSMVENRWVGGGGRWGRVQSNIKKKKKETFRHLYSLFPDLIGQREEQAGLSFRNFKQDTLVKTFPLDTVSYSL